MLTSIELFAGGGGMALGMERAGFLPVLLNDNDAHCIETLRINRPDWNVVYASVSELDFKPYAGFVDCVSGGFPCQAFSHAGKRLGFEDVRGTAFYDFARCIKETNTPVFVAENVKGLTTHDNGNTLVTILSVFEELGYTVQSQVLNANNYKTPQKRERVIIVGVRNDIKARFSYPKIAGGGYVLLDALRAGRLYKKDVAHCSHTGYTTVKRAVMELVPEGGNWRSLPPSVAAEYMGIAYHSGGGKTGVARRLAWQKPCPTLTTSPAQKLTEFCHPDETRPLTVNEYARVQTFPDNWIFSGSQNQQYKQIGNAIPVNFANAISKQIASFITKNKIANNEN